MVPLDADFLMGANLPWLRYGGDIGASAWSPAGGVAQPDLRTRLDTVLARAADRGVSVVRWFLLCDGRAGIEVDAAGHPRGLDACARRDLDAAIEVLERRGLRALFVLFDFMLLHPAREQRGVRMFGRRDWLRDDAARARLIEHVVAPIVAHAAGSHATLGWDLMNEPEWVTLGAGEWRPWRAVSPATMRRFLAEMASAARQHGRAPVTVGLASVRGLRLVRSIDLDFQQVHWYDHVDRPWTLVTPATVHAPGVPLILGEFPTAYSSQSPLAIVSAVRHAGYAGAFAWSLCAEDAFSSEAGCYEALRA